MESVLFVCLGNICRSPIAEGVFRRMMDEKGMSGAIRIDSAGTSGFHQGALPDSRSMEVCKAHGLDISGQRSRRVVDADFTRFDLIVAMDRSNEADLKARAGEGSSARIVRLLEYSPDGPADVPDPYYGGDQGFEQVYGLVTDALGELYEAHDWSA